MIEFVRKNTSRLAVKIESDCVGHYSNELGSFILRDNLMEGLCDAWRNGYATAIEANADSYKLRDKTGVSSYSQRQSN